MATPKQPPKKKLPTGPTKADLLARMGVSGEQPPPASFSTPSTAFPDGDPPGYPLPTDQMPLSPAGLHPDPQQGNGSALPPDPLSCSSPSQPAADLLDLQDDLDAQLGLQKLTLKWSRGMMEKLGSLEKSTGLPGEILLEVLLDHWERIPKAVQQDCLMQGHRIRVERLVISQNHTIATIEKLLNAQNCL